MLAARREWVHLRDARRIAYLQAGDPSGMPALYLHGTPSSATEAVWLERVARERGIRLLAIDRPGYLGSDPSPRPGGAFMTGAQDVLEMARLLELDRFAVLGFSGGAGPALALAALAGPRVSVLHIGGGMGALGDSRADGMHARNRAIFFLMARRPLLAQRILGPLMRIQSARLNRMTDPARAALSFYRAAARGAQTAAVQAYVSQRSTQELAAEMADYIASARCTAAIVEDLTDYVRPWPFDLSTIAAPVEIWHGGADPAVPSAYARATAGRIPGARLHIFEDEGHFVFHTHGDAIADSIVRHGSEVPS